VSEFVPVGTGRTSRVAHHPDRPRPHDRIMRRAAEGSVQAGSDSHREHDGAVPLG
jgi:hypothetical protein